MQWRKWRWTERNLHAKVGYALRAANVGQMHIKNRKVKVTQMTVFVLVLANTFICFGGVKSSITSRGCKRNFLSDFQTCKTQRLALLSNNAENNEAFIYPFTGAHFYRHSSFDKGYRVTIIKHHYTQNSSDLLRLRWRIFTAQPQSDSQSRLYTWLKYRALSS